MLCGILPLNPRMKLRFNSEKPEHKNPLRYRRNGQEENKMYEYIRGNYIYSGNRECGSPVREVKTISEKEAKYWDNIEKQIRQQQNG